MKKILLSIFLLSIILVGCSNSITSNEAEEIAIQTAIDEGYSTPKLYLEYDNKTKERYHYSKNVEKDIKVWEVSLVTDERPREMGAPDLIYYINIKNGEIVDKISGVD
jgi:hypothetical protein